MSHHYAVNPWVALVPMFIALAQGLLMLPAIANRDAAKISRAALRMAACLGIGSVVWYANGNDWIGTSNAFMCAAWLTIWWLTGGGDNTKRRLKKLKEKFVGKRRTAPVTA